MFILLVRKHSFKSSKLGEHSSNIHIQDRWGYARTPGGNTNWNAFTILSKGLILECTVHRPSPILGIS